MSRKITFAGAMSIHSSEGLERNGIDGTRARWIYVNGNDEGREAGILIMTNPLNHNFPEHIRVWDETQNGGRGDIMLNVCPAKFEDWAMPSGSRQQLRYRVYVFDGVMTPDEAERMWQEYVSLNN